MSLVSINYWAEGPTDRAVARKLITHAGARPGADYSGRRRAAPGKDYLDKRIGSFNQAAHFSPWFVLRDSDGSCAVELAGRLLRQPAAKMCFRIVVPAIEAWLMADRRAFAEKMAIAEARLPADLERIAGIKTSVVELARHSQSRHVREELLPDARSGRRYGIGYASFLIEFITDLWDPRRAAKNAPGLKRSIEPRTGS